MSTWKRSLGIKAGLGATIAATLALTACGSTSTGGNTSTSGSLTSCSASVSDLLAGAGGAGKGGTADPSLSGKKLTVTGSSALQPLFVQAAAEFDKVQNTQTVVNAGGSGKGLSDTFAGASQLGMSDIFASEKLTPDQAATLTDHQVAAVAFTLVVNNDLKGKVDNLTADQIKQIYTGQVTSWKQLGGPDEPITAVARPTSSGTRATFKKYVLGNADDTAGTPVQQDNTGAVLAAVKATPGSIGYVTSGFVSSNPTDASPICIDGAKANATDINAGKYQFWSIEHVYTKGPATGTAKALLQYVLSDDVQKNDVPKLNFYTLKSIVASAITAHTVSGAPAPETLS